MIAILRHLACTTIAVSLASAYPLAQGAVTPPEPQRAAPVAQGPAAPVAREASSQPVRHADAGGTREQLRQLLERHPPALANVLRLDPSLLTNPDYLTAYPELAAFLAEHPEVTRNPGYYVGTAHDPSWDRSPAAVALRMWETILQGFLIISIFLTVTGVLVWLVRTLVDYRRWLRLTRVQTETHTKLLDRLTSQEDLLAYMQTPAGRRFLESAPIALDASARPLAAPFGRVLWSVQAGVVLAVLGVGVLFIARSAVPEVADGLRAMGIIGLALGAGFLLSGGIAYVLSSRLGLFDQRSLPALPAEPLGAAAPRGRE